jgi:hypothetical protein
MTGEHPCLCPNCALHVSPAEIQAAQAAAAKFRQAHAFAASSCLRLTLTRFMQNWLLQVTSPSDNPMFQTIAHAFGAGCVALVNRSANHIPFQSTPISEQLSNESAFFLHRSGMHAFLSAPTPLQQLQDGSSTYDEQVTLNELGRACLGLPALIARIDKIIGCCPCLMSSAFAAFVCLRACSVFVLAVL